MSFLFCYWSWRAHSRDINFEHLKIVFDSKKNYLQHVTDLENSRNLFIEIFTVESAKILLSEK